MLLWYSPGVEGYGIQHPPRKDCPATLQAVLPEVLRARRQGRLLGANLGTAGIIFTCNCNQNIPKVSKSINFSQEMQTLKPFVLEHEEQQNTCRAGGNFSMQCSNIYTIFVDGTYKSSSAHLQPTKPVEILPRHFPLASNLESAHPVAVGLTRFDAF